MTLDTKIGKAVRRERWALVVLAAVAGARTLVSIAPALRFDSDPAIVPGAFAGLGPSGSLLLDAIGAAAMALLAAARWLRLRVEGQDGHDDARGVPLVLLAALPVPAFLVLVLAPHGSFSDLWRGATWLVAAFAAVMVSGTDRAGRAIVGGALMGAAAAMALRGVHQLLIEHPALVEYFERSRESFLASRGWTPGSAAALAYERRLRQPEASGWLGLANVLSGILASASMRLALLAWASRAARHPHDVSGAPMLRRGARPDIGGTILGRFDGVAGLMCATVALLSVALVLINGSKGAIGAFVLGAVTMPLLLRATRAPSEGGRRWWPRVLACLVLAAPFIVIVRGALLGETPIAERSMLFRWHYTIGTLRVLVESPWTGVGVGGFQDAYARLRPWMSPEEVVSAHSAFLDWLAAFGLGGAGLIALAVVLLVRALRSPFEPVHAPPSTDREARATVRMAALSAGLAGALAMVFTSSSDLTPDGLVLRGVLLIVGSMVAAAVARLVIVGNARIVCCGTALSALVLLVHAQVDMDFWLPGSAWWCWLLLGSAASAASRDAGSAAPRADRTPHRRSVDRGLLSIVGAASLVAAVLLAIMSVRAGVQERASERAALLIERAVESGEAPPRAAAAALLAEATQAIPGNAALWSAAVEQAMRAIDLVPRDDRTARLDRSAEAIRLAQQAFDARPEIETARVLVESRYLGAIERRRQPDASVSRGPSDSEVDAELLMAMDEVLRSDPRSLPAWRRSVEIRMLLGDDDGARAAAKRMLEIDASYALDPLRRLSDTDRAALERLIGGREVSAVNAAPSSDGSPPR